MVELEAKRCGALYVTERWIGGTITNFKVIKKNIDKLLNLIKRREEGDLAQYTKKERLLIDREIEKLQRDIGGIVGMRGAPGAVFVVDVRREKTSIREAKRSGVPVVALVDTNSDPTDIDYAIPGNDDAIKAIALILKVVSSAVEEGYREYAKTEEAKEKEVEGEKQEQAGEVEVSKDKAEKDTAEKKEKTKKVGRPKKKKDSEKEKEK